MNIEETLRSAQALALTVPDAREDVCPRCNGQGIVIGEPVLGGVTSDAGQPCRGCAQTGVVFRVRQQSRAYSPPDFVQRFKPGHSNE